MINREEFFEDILKLKGFWSADFSDKWKILVMWPFVFAFFVFCLVMWIPHVPALIKSRLKR